MSLVLHGYHYSVYNRIARLALAEKGVAYDRVEVNPFADTPTEYQALHPFGRVPTLVHDGFVLYETGAITRYVDRAFPGPALQPATPRALARMDQLIGIIDSYGYWPMVRQVFSHRAFRSAIGRPVDEAEVAQGLIGLLDLRQHQVEGVDKPADFVLAGGCGAHGVVLLGRDSPGGAREVHDGT